MRGIDLATEWRSRRWRKLLNLIDRLPRNSQFVEAQANDEDAARALFAVVGDALPEPTERWSEWSPEREALARLEDRLQDLTRAVVASGGSKPGQFRPARRPTSAMQGLREARRVDQHRTLVARVLPP